MPNNLPDLSGSLIQDTYKRVVHTDGNILYDGTGSVVLDATELKELQSLGSNDVDWTYLASIDQSLNTHDPVLFKKVTSQLTSTNPGPTVPQVIGKGGFKGLYLGEKTSADVINFVNASTVVSYVDTSGNYSGLAAGLYDTPDITVRHIITTGNISSSGYISASNFIGDGSQITGVTGEWDGTHTGTANFTGSIIASGNISCSETIYATHLSCTGEIEAEDDISASGDVYGTDLIGTGNISASGDVYGTDLIGTGGLYTTGTGINKIEGTLTLGSSVLPFGTLRVDGASEFTSDITASGEISASGTISAAKANIRGMIDNDHAGAYGIKTGYVTATGAGVFGANLSCFANSAFGDSSTDTHTFKGHITASGNISSSGDITADKFNSKGSQYKLNGDKALYLDSTDLYVGHYDHKTYITSSGTVDISGHITASGNISCSGNLYFDTIDGGTF